MSCSIDFLNLVIKNVGTIQDLSRQILEKFNFLAQKTIQIRMVFFLISNPKLSSYSPSVTSFTI